MSGRLSGRRIVVTGAANGIALATAERFAAEGARVALIDRDEIGLSRAAHKLGARQDDRHVALAADVTRAEQVDKAVADAARRLGGLDGIVNGAGADLERTLDRMTDAEWSAIIEVNLTGAMRVCRAAVPHIVAAGGGSIVNIASGAGLFPLAERSAYCAAKAGLVMFGKVLALELAPANIRVNAVCPGAIETAMFRASWETKADPAATLARIKTRYALARIGEPREIADAVLWLTSSEASYVTGAAIAVDGGRTFH